MPSGGRAKTYGHVVELPGKIEAIHELLLGRANPVALGWQEFEVVNGSPAALLIKGTNLWRSTEVTLGAQAADEIRVLPDMAGIIARFQTVKEPTSVDGTLPRSVDVNIWTSGGNQQVGEAKIYPPKKDGGRWKIGWKQTRVVKEEEISVELLEGALPDSFFKMELVIEGFDPTTATWVGPIRLPAATRTPASKMIAAKLTSGPPLTPGMEIRASVWVFLRPDSAAADVKATTDGSIVYYSDAKEAKIAVVGPASIKSGSTSTLTFTFPKKVEQAFPGFTNRH